MLGGGRLLKPVRKIKRQAVNGEENREGDRRRGWRQVSYARLGCRGITRITLDRKRRQSPEMSPFSALLMDSKKRPCNGHSPLCALNYTDPLEPREESMESPAPLQTAVSPTPYQSAVSPTPYQSVVSPTRDAGSTGQLCESLARCCLEDSLPGSPLTLSTTVPVSPPTTLQTTGTVTKWKDQSPRVATSPDELVQCSPKESSRSSGAIQSPLQCTNHCPPSTQTPDCTSNKLAPLLTPIILQGCPVIPSPLLHYLSPAHSVPLSEREKALALCKQTNPTPLDDFFTENMVSTLTKLGEGAFAEVFGCQNEDKEKLALKIVPIEGDFKYNDDHQSTFAEILPEMVVTRELSLLGEEGNKENKSVPNFTQNFLQIDRMGVCVGEYPGFLLDAWEDYDIEYKSQNDKPDIFPATQLYVVFSAKDAGIPVEDYVFHSFEEAWSILAQVAATLAVGEAALEFEHRDLHRSNILVKKTHNQDSVYFRLHNKDHFINTHGVRATIVDYTLSRIRQGECVSYNDLNRLDWLFTGKGDIQFDVYRQMRDVSKSNWESYVPHTNVLWLNYLVTKISQSGKVKDISRRTWRAKFRSYLKEILQFPSAQEAFTRLFQSES